MSHYTLVSEWQLEAPIERVWTALTATQAWPTWWKFVEAAKAVEPGDASGVGAVTRYTWASRLPYRLTFDMRTTVMERPHRIEGEALGDLRGHGRWLLRQEGAVTRVEYTWSVDTDKAWMNALAPLLAPVFSWNHGQVMLEGGRGLARHLGAKLLAVNGKAC